MPGIDCDAIYGPNRAALRREKQFPKTVNYAINQASDNGTRFVKIKCKRLEDAKELCDYINSTSKYKASIVERKTIANSPQEKQDDAIVRRVDHILCNVLDLLDRSDKFSGISVEFELPQVSHEDLATYEAKCKAYEKAREEQIEKLRKQQQRNYNPFSHQVEDYCARAEMLEVCEASVGAAPQLEPTSAALLVNPVNE